MANTDDIQHKPHYFEVTMRSVSTDESGQKVLNQEVPILREYAKTPGELVAKQSQFCDDLDFGALCNLVWVAIEKQANPIRQIGIAEIAADFEKWAGQPPGQAKKR